MEELRAKVLFAFRQGQQIAIYQGGCVYLGKVIGITVMGNMTTGFTLGYAGWNGMTWHKEFNLGEWPSWTLCSQVYGEYIK